ncbi:hypothetical protein, partial [Klebsiella pneumoniae]|uniref:hypothetical protein n=1 Tax=Klebsiella pneumoniae TaxID=573 RepID=UPI0013A53917
WETELSDIVNFYLDDLDETALVCNQTWEQGQRVYAAAEGDASILEVLSRVAAEQCERLLPRPEEQPSRNVPQATDIF